MKKYSKLILKLSVSVLLFGFLLWKLDRQSLVDNIKLLNLAYVPLIILFLILNYILSSFRWKNLLSIYEKTEHVTLGYLTSLYFIGSFFNNFMPTSVGGDVFKIFKLGNKIDNKAHAFSATFMERFTGIVALLLISCISLVQLLGLTGVLLFIGFWVCAIAGFFVLKLLSKRFKKLEGLYNSLIQYKGKNKVLLSAFVTSFIVQFLAIFTQYFIFTALGVNLPIAYTLFVFPVITLASFFIPSLNGVGVQDALFVQLLAPVGVGAELAVSASILYHLFRLGVSLIGGVLYATGKAE